MAGPDEDPVLDDGETIEETEAEEVIEGGEEAEEKAPEWQREMARMREENEQARLQMFGALSKIAEQLGERRSPSEPKAKEKPEDEAEVWKLGLQAPEIMPQLVERQIKKGWEEQSQALEQRLMDKLGKQNAAEKIRQHILDNYGDDLSDRKSKILRSTPDVKKLLSPFLDPAIRGSDTEDQLSYLVSAALNPEAVAKKHVARAKREEAQRAEQLNRTAAMAGFGTRKQASKEAEITDKDLEIAEQLGINLDDEKVKARILQYKKEERLVGWGNLKQEEA